MRRREALALLGAAAAWPLAAGAQQQPRPRHLGALFVVNEESAAPRWAVLRDELRKLGWTEGENLLVDLRFAGADAERIRRYAAEMLSRRPELVFAQGVLGAAALQRAAASVPVVFAQVQDPVGGGVVTSLSRPDGNFTGFTDFGYSIAAKWLQLLKEATPGVARVLVLLSPDNRARWDGYFAAFDAQARSLGVEIVRGEVHDSGDIERAVEAFAASAGGGLVVPPDAVSASHAGLIVALAAHHRLPAVYGNAALVRRGGMLAFSSHVDDQYRGAAAYIDRLLRGARVSELPVQASTRFELVVNARTAAALGLSLSPSMLARADEVIE